MPENTPNARASTRVPRWTAPEVPASGTGEHREPLGDRLHDDLLRFARDNDVDVRDVLLATHLKVLSTVTAEAEVGTGYVPDAATAPLPVRARVVAGTWRDLFGAVRDRGRERVDDSGIGDSEVILDLSGFDPTGPGSSPAPLPGGVAIRVRWDERTLRLDYRRDVVDAEYVRRFVGYHRTALALALRDPDAPHEQPSLLSEQEVHTQLHELAGPRREPPDRLFVELFEEQVRAYPERTAAVHRGVRRSYAELNQRANAIARALLAHGLGAEDPVAVVMERNLDWAAATLGVFKAGGVYLPVRPDFPADRIATQLTRSDCRFVVTEPGAMRNLEPASRRVIFANEVGDGVNDNPGVAISGDQLAYVYFTSGSTGAPKGAMCEHAGMLNHLYAKVDDMGLGPADVVAQTASQCFDISLWQLIAPLLVGGRVHIVDTDTQLDVPRFLDEIVAGGVSVAQLVPSYLDVLLSHLERHPRDLGALRSVSVTGEALKMEPVQRWFARYPDITLVNAYGATEVSDDTMHEVLDRVPSRGFVSVGRSLRNVHTYVLDENLRLAPLGSPGEIAFSGVCVGRGYINDEERTREAFVADPYRPGTRMYRTGDFGRWLPEGRIEFLGRRDQQVKIRGFRIEIGEIENRLSGMPGVRDAAVVIDEASGNKILVAFYSGPASLPAGRVRDHLAASLPPYMVPTYLHWLESLPLNENGKVDKKVLRTLAGTLGHAGAAVAPGTVTERRLATAWAEALNVPLERIGRDDSFFDLGGTSLAAVRLVVKLDRMLSLTDVVRHPVLRDLAAKVEARSTGGSTASGSSLLQPLSGTVAGAVATLVCFPYAGGNAVNFQLLAKELEREGVAVYGVELPGHDLAGPDFAGGDEALAEVEDVARAVCAEIEARIDTPVALWGHCAGAAHALATARLLERGPAKPRRVFVAAMLLDEVDRLRAESDEVSALDNREITSRLLAESAYVELDGLKPERADLVGSAYRHDVCSTNRYFIAARLDPAAHRSRCDLDVIVAADDPTTAGYADRHRDWAPLTGRMTLHTLDEGGHYFVRTRAADCAAIVVAGLGVDAGAQPDQVRSA